jgi:phosphatidylinositol N-acetylglucosaminyltransferase subunit H
MLSIKRPTATTVLYTVSTRAPTTTWTARVAASLFLLLRILVGFFVATVLLLAYQKSQHTSSWAGILPQLEHLILSSVLGERASVLIDSFGQIYWMLICIALTWFIFRKAYTEESLLVIRGLGVQTSTSSRSYLGTSSTRFIPTTHIQDIFIYEAFKGFEVRFYLSIVVEGEEDVVVVFPVRTSTSFTG